MADTATAIEALRQAIPHAYGPDKTVMMAALDHLERLAAERDSMRAELSLWKPLTPAEAEQAYANAKAEPWPEEKIQAMVKRITDPAERLDNNEQAQLAAANARLTALVERLAELVMPMSVRPDAYPKSYSDYMAIEISVPLGHCRRAAALLAEVRGAKP